MFPIKCNNCGSDQISGPHKMFSHVGQPWIIIENPKSKILGMNKSIKIQSYICLNCGQIKFFVPNEDLEKINENLKEEIVK